MGSIELANNLFRIAQTEDKLKRDNIQGETEACKTHNKIGKIVRKAIKEAGGTMPEDLPTPKKSLKQLERENLNSIDYCKFEYSIKSFNSQSIMHNRFLNCLIFHTQIFYIITYLSQMFFIILVFCSNITEYIK